MTKYYLITFKMIRVVRIIFCLVVIFCGSCSNSNSSDKKDSGQAASSNLKDDLKKIKWIEGKWKGIYNGAPFYEIYDLVNDSTLMITSFEWNGKDSSKTSKSYLGWFEDAYYLGNEKNYKVTTITDSQIFMVPNYKASNSVLWRFRTDSSWDAILEGPKATNKYLMERFDPFKGR